MTRMIRHPLDGLMDWPETVPADLKLRLLDALSYRSCGADDIWDEVRAWLIDHAVDAPASAVRLDRADEARSDGRGAPRGRSH